MPSHETINYIEFATKDLAASKAFFETCFEWKFTDYGPEYSSFSDERVDGGFFQSEVAASTKNGSVLIVFYSAELEATQAKIEKSGGTISHPIFSFPGGRRFHFIEPGGNEFAVWSDPE